MEKVIEESEAKRNFSAIDIEGTVFKWYELVEKELAEQGPTDRVKALRKLTNVQLFGYETQLRYWDMRAEYNAEHDLPEEEPVISEEFRDKLKKAAEMKARVKKQWKKAKKHQKRKTGNKKKKADKQK
jgi:hypothetical protein